MSLSTNSIDMDAGVTITGLTDDDLIIGNTSGGTSLYVSVPDCHTNNMLTYTQSTHSFCCDA
ncbi:MAG: hypothetical protein IIC10_07020, partial [Proteobacteria bacterium]|nr:hypothetical protein [Pseudomonadota bacterium]